MILIIKKFTRMEEFNDNFSDKIDPKLSQKYNTLERESSELDEIVEIDNLKSEFLPEKESKEIIKKKEAKMIFDRGFNYFDDKQEDKFFEIRKKAAVLKQKIENSENLGEGAKLFVEKEINKIKIEWPALFGKECNKMFVHIDLDSFYASVETLDHPEYKDVPMAVGSNLMIAACNYKAREYGVRSGMPGYQARDICPMLVIAKLNFVKYNYYSELVMEILSSYDPEIEIYGIDEACLSFTKEKFEKAINYFNTNKTNGRSYGENKDDDKLNNEFHFTNFSFEAVNDLIYLVRKIIYRNTGLTVSAGISVCRGLAKLSSKVNKPNGQFVLEKDFLNYIENKDVDEINGIGECTKELLLRSMNIRTIKELKEKIYLCSLVFKPKTFSNILRLSFGLSFFDSPDHRPRNQFKPKSQGVEISILPCSSYSDILFYLWNLSGQLDIRLNKLKQASGTLTIKLRYINYDMITRRKKCLQLLTKQTEIFDLALSLVNSTFHKISKYNEYEIFKPINLIGISLSRLVSLDNVNIMDKFLQSKYKYTERTCIICNKKFFNENYKIFELHVNKCIDESQKKVKIKENRLDHFFK